MGRRRRPLWVWHPCTSTSPLDYATLVDLVVIGGSCFTSSLNDEACGLEFVGRLSLSTNCTSGGGEADAITCETTGM